MKHSPLAPSSAHRWGAPLGCPGWVLMNMLHPETGESEAAREGTAAHEIAEELVRDQKKSPLLLDRAEFVGKLSKSGVAYTDDMYDAAAIYAKAMGGLMRSARVLGGPFVNIEKSIPILSIHPQCFGTVDYWMFDRKKKALYLTDFKYGFGVVEPFENWQLMAYASGILDALEQTEVPLSEVSITFYVVQPRAFHRDGPIRTWTTDAATLDPFFASLKTNAGVAMGPNARTTSGPHCKNCAALPVCPAAQRAAMAAIDCVDAVRVDQLDGVSMSTELKALKRAAKAVEYRLEAMSESVSSALNAGTVVPDFEMSSKGTRRKWALPIPDLLAVGDASGVNLRKLDAVLTPKQAITAGMSEMIVKQLSELPKGDLKLTGINHNKAREVFGS